MAARDLDLLRRWVADARRRTLELFDAIDDAALLGPKLAIVNPPAWEYGHVAWFQERWALREAARRAPLRPGSDALYDSSAIPHDVRWDLPLPSRADTVAYLRAAAAATREVLPSLAPETRALVELTVLHEDMHAEALAFTRQTLGYAAPRLSDGAGTAAPFDGGAGDLAGDVAVPGGTWRLGARGDEPFAFDNEQWEHPCTVEPFAIARAPVTQAAFAAFVDAGGYARRALWSDAGWAWRVAAGAEHPVYWERRDGAWGRRDFDRWVPLEPHRPVVNVNLFEAEAFCRAAERRLPTELEWEVAAAGEPDGRGGLSERKRPYPWGDAPASPERANLDFRLLHPLDVAALPAGDSAFGCRQLLGNVWEWTASPFLPWPGFAPGAYRDYSAPWFGTHQVIRGGSFATTSRVARNGFRNFYTPERRDPWVGFRTCATAGSGGRLPAAAASRARTP